ncbi:MAG: PTS sugar transporter subunit IIA [Thermoguttaceae bacterium]|nr:PTS sugar transporter subunit IIA [Thermoguttaceae bacterium]
MQRTYTLSELATFLRRSERELKTLAEKGVLQGRQRQGEWIFDLPSVSQWMEEEIARGDLVKNKDLEEAVAKISQEEDARLLRNMMSVDLIDLAFPARTKSSALSRMTQMAESCGRLWDAAAMTDALREREEMSSTAFEEGFAILHPRRPQPDILPENFLAIGISPSGIPFGAERGRLTDVFFLLCCQSDASYLRALGRLTRILKQSEFLDQLRECASPIDALNLFEDAENAIAE